MQNQLQASLREKETMADRELKGQNKMLCNFSRLETRFKLICTL